MKKKIFVILLGYQLILNADPSIITSLKKPPLSVIKSIESEHIATEKIGRFVHKSPALASRKLLKSQLITSPQRGGYLALYKGYSTTSTPEGVITFPIRHVPVDTVFLTVTPNVKLFKIDGNTFAHAEIDKTVRPEHVAVYEYKKRTEEVDDNTRTYWKVTQKNYPKDDIIHPHSIIILTKPKNLYIQEGDFLIFDDKTSNIALPHNIYVLANNNAEDLLAFLDTNRYYDPIHFSTKKPSGKVTQQIIEN